MYFPKGFTLTFSPPCPDCLLQNYRKNYYQLVVAQAMAHRKLQVRVAGYI